MISISVSISISIWHLNRTQEPISQYVMSFGAFLRYNRFSRHSEDPLVAVGSRFYQ
jgi:hypothetical protein